MADYLPFIIFLMLLAVFLRADSALTVIYMVIGTFFLGYWWNHRALKHLEVSREYQKYAFLGDHITVQVKIINRSFLPILWLEIHEGLSVDLRGGKSIKHVFNLAMRATKIITYDLYPNKRGFYQLGPLRISSGDPLGLFQPTQKEFPSSPITVYPQIVNMAAFGLPSLSPFGSIKHHNPIYEDPNRIMGKRDYQNGDSIRRIDWKSTAATGKLQVKQYEASIALQIAILLDLHRDSYDIKSFYTASESAIAAAASVAAWGKTHRQTVGLVSNGVDPLHQNEFPTRLHPQKGAGHFINILEILARIQASEEMPSESLIQETLARLSWGATLVFISGSISEFTLSLLNQSRRNGIMPAIILSGPSPNYQIIKNQAIHFHIDLHRISYPSELITLGTG
jgi:uncharacterized protein (DUF58 family)